MTNEKQQRIEALNAAVGLLWRLDRYGYVQTFNPDEEEQCQQWSSMIPAIVVEAKLAIKGIEKDCA